MLSHLRKLTCTGWLYLAVILLVLYVGQTYPHDHSVPGHAADHTEHHDTPIPHTHHSHSHDHGTGDDAGEPWQPHHHHISQHVDSHSLPAASHGLSDDPEQSPLIALLVSTADADKTGAIWIDVDIWPPETIPILSLVPRAPPARG